MDIPLRVLIIEDSDRDVALEVRALKAAGYQVTYAVAETAIEMKAALAEQSFDIVISDHALPQFDAPGALAVLKQSGLDIPFIIVSGAIGEETAVALMKAGANDYVMKDRLARLVPAVQKELREAESRREHKRLEEARRNEQIMLARTESIAHVGSWEWDIATDTVNWSDELFQIFQRDPREGAPSFAEHPAFYHPDDMARLRQAVEAAVADGTPYELELRAIRKDGETRICVARGVAELGLGGRAVRLFGSLQDITERKKSEESLKVTLESLRKAVNATIQVMVSAVERRDPYTSGHQSRSADLARAIASEMGLPKDKIEGIRVAGSIHDIGKLSIPAEILSKPTKLSAIELSLIQEHARQGYEVLKDVESPWPLAEIIHQHHERMDGSGYPRNLKGEEILIEARILTVADVVEAMASHRPYRPGLGIDAALNEIEKNRGILYDNAVADACLKLFREKGFQLERT